MLVLSFFTVFIIGRANTQQIQNLSVSPPVITEIDTVKITADVINFTSGGCSSSSFNLTQLGFHLHGSSYHHLGALAVICSSIDEFVLGTYSPGTYTYVHTVQSSSGGVDVDSLQFTVSPLTDLQMESKSASVRKIYPVPCNDRLYIELDKPIKNGCQVIITDLQGQVLLQKFFNLSGDLLSIDLNTPEFSSGLYYFRCINEEKEWIEQFLIHNN